MNRLIQDINMSLKNEEEKNSQVFLTRHEEAMVWYEELRRRKDPIELRFDASDSKGALITYDENGIRLIVHKKDQILSRYQQRFGTLVGVNLSVFVKSVSRKEDTITLAMARGSSTLVHELTVDIDRDLKNNITPRLFGRIAKIVDTKDKRFTEAWVRLLDRNIPGTINVRDWSNTFTDSLRDVISVGEVYEFDVIGSRPMKSRKNMNIYKLSRKDITVNPWLRLPKDLKDNDVILVKCTNRPADKKYWWGVSPIFKGVHILGVYNKDLNIVRDGWYKCYISRLDIEEQVFRVLPIEFYPISDLGNEGIKNVAVEIDNQNKR